MKVTEEDLKIIKEIKNNYPKTWDWIKHKCNWEQMVAIRVLNEYRDYVNELMGEENNERN